MTCSYKTSQGTKCQMPHHVDDLCINHNHVSLYCPVQLYYCKNCFQYHNRHTDCYRCVPDAPQCSSCGAFHLMGNHYCAYSQHHVEAEDLLELFTPGKLEKIDHTTDNYAMIDFILNTDDYDISVAPEIPRKGYPHVHLPQAEVLSYHCLPYYGTFIVNMLKNYQTIPLDFWKKVKINFIFGQYYVQHGEDIYLINPNDEQIETQEWFEERARVIRKFYRSGAHWLLYLISDATDVYLRDWHEFGEYDEFRTTFTLILDDKIYKCNSYDRGADRDDATCWSADENFECLEIKLDEEEIFDGYDQLCLIMSDDDDSDAEYTEQLDEGEGDKETHPNKALAKVEEKERVENQKQPTDNLETPSESKESNQAIDTPQEIIGVSCGRKTIRVKTPSGEKEAIVISDCLDIPNPKFTLTVHLPEIGNVWSSIPPSEAPVGSTYAVNYSHRTRYLMEMYTHYNGSAVYKIVAKIPLFQSQKFWVSFIPYGVTPTDVFRLSGFEWNPSEQNEIYVVIPWSSTEYMLPYDEIPGSINISPITGLVTTDGLASPIQINVYTCPYKMKLYIPRPVKSQLETNKLNCLDIISNEVIPKLSSILPIPYKATEASSIVFPGGLAQVVGGLAEPGILSRDMSISEFSSIINCKSILVAASKVIGRNQFLQTFDPYIRTQHIDDAPSFTQGSEVFPMPLDVRKDAAIKNSDGDIVASWKTTGEINKVTIPDNFDIGDFAFENCETVINSNVIKATMSPLTFSNTGYKAEEYTEQIYEYEYETPKKQVNLDHGKSDDHTRRLDSHYQVQYEAVVDKDSSVAIIPLYTNIADDYCFYDAQRHLFFGGYPIVKLAFASTPSTNALLRFTLVNSRAAVALGDALQLPGIEIDPKVGTYDLLPWWSYTYPLKDYNKLIADASNNWTLQCHVLSGSFGTGSPIRICCMYNTSHLTYAHLRGVDTLGKPASTEEYTEQMSESAPDAKSNQQGEIKSRPEEGVSSDSERRWNFVSSFKVASDVALVQIPIDRAIMGSWFHIHNSRYHRWRGNLKLKIMVNNSSIVNGNIHVTQANTAVIGTTVNVQELLEKISYSSGGAPGKPLLIDVEWRNLKPWLVPSDNLGYLYIAIPQRTVNNFSTDDSFQFTIYADVSDIELSMPVDPKGFSTWPGITVTTFKAEKTAVETLGLGTSVCR